MALPCAATSPWSPPCEPMAHHTPAPLVKMEPQLWQRADESASAIPSCFGQGLSVLSSWRARWVGAGQPNVGTLSETSSGPERHVPPPRSVMLRPTNRGGVHITWKCLAQPSPTLGRRQRAAAERRAPVGGPRGAKPAPPPILKGSGGTFVPIHADVKRGREKKKMSSTAGILLAILWGEVHLDR